ncbi:helix-turn-helix domain-containing protein [uncultured Aquimarina sp.]|uniref:helix-turn-helix domain-containing protein n=1 Tax=uncultured Aquimarina sp. TaxID=575652 RepID=UPI00262859FB|nr:helix-turn-helix domain-containing protein [uncultured Aquimarina sp.]
MSDLLKPLYTLTVGEYMELNRTIFKQQLQELLSNQGELVPQTTERDIIFIDEACELTGYSKPTMYSKISRLEIPVLSKGKPLTFSKQGLIEWIHQGKPNVR